MEKAEYLEYGDSGVGQLKSDLHEISYTRAQKLLDYSVVLDGLVIVGIGVKFREPDLILVGSLPIMYSLANVHANMECDKAASRLKKYFERYLKKDKAEKIK